MAAWRAARSGTVRSPTLATLAEQNRCQGGAHDSRRRPLARTPTPPLHLFPCGPATRWRRVRGRCAMAQLANRCFKPLSTTPGECFQELRQFLRWMIMVLYLLNGTYGPLEAAACRNTTCDGSFRSVTITTDLKNPNFAKLAEAIGIMGVRIENPADVSSGMKRAFQHSGPALIDRGVRTDHGKASPLRPDRRGGGHDEDQHSTYMRSAL
jgi:hypothetical protein